MYTGIPSILPFISAQLFWFTLEKPCLFLTYVVGVRRSLMVAGPFLYILVVSFHVVGLFANFYGLNKLGFL